MTLRLPRLAGVVERRLLVNYRVDPEVCATAVPAPFRPQVVDGAAVAGICLIRLGSLRPPGLPARLGVRTENAAHRFAVEWDDGGVRRTGVYIPRRDTDSRLSALVGGRIFPGRLHHAAFDVTETADRLRVAFTADDGSAHVAVDVSVADGLTQSRVFPDLATASAFFENGAAGFSDTTTRGRYDGMALRTDTWAVEAGVVNAAESSFFADESVFPRGSAELDCALVMRQVPVVWDALPRVSVA